MAKPESITWTAISGKYFDSAANAHYFQIGNKVVIMNGVDTLAYLNINSSNVTSSTVVPFTALSNPSAPTLGTNGVGGTGFNITYRITANSTAGETAASNALTVAVDTDRDFWNPPSAGGTDHINITWSAVSSAVSYNVYMGTVSGYEFLIATGVNGTSYDDDGSAVQDNTRLYPTTNSTAGPVVTRGANIGGRAFLVGDVNNPYQVWNGGDIGNELDFTPVNGGGYSVVNSGGAELPQAVKLHRDGKGNAVIKVYCTGTKGKRFTLTPDSVTYGNTVISFYDVQEDEGQIGTNAPDALLYYNNSMWYPSSEGFETDGTLPQIQNVLTTRRTSNTIESLIPNLNQSAMGGACGFVMNGRLCWALPVNSSYNNQIWTLDVDRKGAWMEPWDIAADWMWTSTDNTGNLHYLILSENGIYDMSYSSLTTDMGSPITTRGQSGQIYFSDDKRMWAQLLQVVIVVLSPQGSIDFSITGKTEDSDLTALGEPYNFSSTASFTPAGWSEPNRYIVGWGRNAWSKVNTIPTSTSVATQEIPIPIDEEVQWAAYSWVSKENGVDYNISDVILEYIETGVKDLE